MRSLLALGGGGAARRPGGRSTAAGSGPGYGHPTPRPGPRPPSGRPGSACASEPTYTAKALAAAFERLDAGRRVVFLQTLSA